MATDIRFGTDGWRSVIGEDFTYANVRRVADAAGRVIAADNAPDDPRTRVFAESYLRPLGIGSMLAAPIRVSGQLVAGPVRPGEVQPPDFRKAFGQERLLYTGGGIQVALHALIRAGEILILPLDLCEGFPQLLRHAVERLREVSHEIDTLAQVALGDLLGLPGQVAKIGVEILEGLQDMHLAGGDVEIEVAA